MMVMGPYSKNISLEMIQHSIITNIIGSNSLLQMTVSRYVREKTSSLRAVTV